MFYNVTIMIERTLILLKPDAVARGLVGEIISRFERVGLKIVAAKMLKASADMINEHYPVSREELIREMGQKTLDNNKKNGVDTKAISGTDDPHELGLKIQQWNVDYLQTGPIWALIIAGPQAISIVRKIRGATLPAEAPPGTINGDHSFDSSLLANPSQRSIRNLVHASGNLEEAELEIKIWFSEAEIYDYDTIHQTFMLS